MGLIAELVFTLFWAISLSMTLLFVGARMLCVGLSVDTAEVTRLRHDPSFVARALLANVIVVPALGVALAATLPLPTEAMLALVLVAAIPGGVDFMALVARPSAASRNVMAVVFVLSLVAVAAAPAVRLLLEPLGAVVVASSWRLIVVSLLAVLVPLAAGLMIRRAAPAVADVLVRATASVAVVLFVAAALATFLVRAPAVRSIGARGILVMVLLTAGAAGAGWLLGGPSRPRRALLAQVTALRNAGLSLLLAIVSFPDAGVDAAVLLFIVVELSLRLGATVLGWPAPIASPRDGVR